MDLVVAGEREEPGPIVIRVPCHGGALAELPERIEGHPRGVCVRIAEIDTADADCVFGHAPTSSGRQTTRTTAIAWQSACESDKDEVSQPWRCACSATVPLRRSRGSEPSRITSISVRGNGMSGFANALITASLAANRAASLCARLWPWQSSISVAV